MDHVVVLKSNLKILIHHRSFYFYKILCRTSTGSSRQQNNTLMRVKLGGHVEGLINPDMSKKTLRLQAIPSAVLTRIFMCVKVQRGNNVGDISNHTGIAREPTNQTKLDRDAIYEPRR